MCSMLCSMSQLPTPPHQACGVCDSQLAITRMEREGSLNSRPGSSWWRMTEPGDAGPSTSDAQSETAARAAERHRLSSMEQIVDLQAFAACLADALPYLLLLGALFLTNFCVELMQFLLLTTAVLRVNRKLRRQLASKDVQFDVLAKLATFVGLFVCSIMVVSDFSWAWRSMILMPPVQRPPTVAAAVFRVIVTDTLVRLLWTFPKLLLLLTFRVSWPWSSGIKSSPTAAARTQGRLLTVAEHALLLYRTLLPTHTWYSYLLGCSTSQMLSSLLTGLYLALKFSDCQHYGKLLHQAIALAMRRGANWGTYVATGQQVAGGVHSPVQDRRQGTLSPVISALAASLPSPFQPAQAAESPPDTLQPGASQPADDDLEAGQDGLHDGICSICHDTLTNAVELPCSQRHRFCEDCISEWLERHRTCPMCRAEVRPVGLTSYADGTTPLLPIVF